MSQKPPTLYEFLSPPQSADELGRLGDYRILRVLGVGGMGTVFEAEDVQLHRPVALKVLQLQCLDDTMRQRFLREARLASSLSSDRIVRIYHIGEDHGVPYIVMEMLKGETLEDRMQREPTLPVHDALRIAREVADGLAAAHEKGLIHRDIKPANVWLERGVSASTYRVKLLDFGIARPMSNEGNLTMEGQILGTPGFICPEQACGEPLDARSDLFALGCLLYAMLAGESPFERDDPMQSIIAAVDEEPRPIRELLPQLPRTVETLLKRLLSKDPAKRPANARQLVDEIRLLELTASGTSALQPTTMPNRGKSLAEKIRVRKLGWNAWAGLAAVVITVLIGGWIEYLRFTTHRDGPPSVTNAANPPDEETPNARTGAVAGVAPTRAASSKSGPAQPALPPVHVGVLHSLSGPLAGSERSIVDACILAIDELNAEGGVLGGRHIEAVVRDGKSRDEVFARQADELITEAQAITLFGCWSSSSRKAVERVCRQHDHLLIYPATYEGLEQSPHVVYLGGAPNQQITPAVKWAFAFLGKRKFFLVGLDEVYSRAAHEIVKDELKSLGAEVVSEKFLPIGSADFDELAKQILDSGADMVLNTVSGPLNVALFAALREAKIKPDMVPVLSFKVTEEDLRAHTVDAESLAGDYAAWSYFQSMPQASNQQLIERFRRRFGSTRVVTDPMAAAYTGVRLWALAVDSSQSERPSEIRQSLRGQQWEAPEGLVTIDADNQHARRMALVGQVGKDLEFEVVWTSPKPIAPQPFPSSRSRKAWEEFLK